MQRKRLALCPCFTKNIFVGRDEPKFLLDTYPICSPFHNTNINTSSFAAFQKLQKAASYLEPSQTSTIVHLGLGSKYSSEKLQGKT